MNNISEYVCLYIESIYIGRIRSKFRSISFYESTIHRNTEFRMTVVYFHMMPPDTYLNLLDFLMKESISYVISDSININGIINYDTYVFYAQDQYELVESFVCYYNEFEKDKLEKESILNLV